MSLDVVRCCWVLLLLVATLQDSVSQDTTVLNLGIK